VRGAVRWFNNSNGYGLIGRESLLRFAAVTSGWPTIHEEHCEQLWRYFDSCLSLNIQYNS